jgi:hypothetical protein
MWQGRSSQTGVAIAALVALWAEASAQTALPCAALRPSDEFMTRNVDVIKRDGTRFRGVQALGLDVNERSISFQDIAGNEMDFPLAELDKIEVMRELHVMNPAEQVAAWRIEQIEAEPVSAEVALADVAIEGDRIRFAAGEDCEPNDGRSTEIDTISYDTAKGAFMVTGEIARYQRVTGGGGGSVFGFGKE